MSAKIKFSFTPTPEDITRGLRAYAVKQRRTWIILGGMALAAVILIGRITTDGFDQYAPYGIFAGFAFVLYSSFVFGVNPWREGRRFAESLTSQLEQTWTAGARGMTVQVQTPDGKLVSKTIEWERFRQVYQAWSDFLLQEVGEKAVVHIIPKRAFQSDNQRERFWSLVQSNTRKPSSWRH